tara:strand:- start:127 stop:963 length:837 start_codon:yes stop_codon:yes gene_type:complete
MIVWISSYPKSGNTHIRSFLSSYYFSKKGKFNFDQLKNILQFPDRHYATKDYFSFEEASRNWINHQNHFFDKKKFFLLKTHNSLKLFKKQKFTTSNETLGAIYIVRDPRNVISSMSNYFSMSLDEAYSKLIDDEASLSAKTINGDCSNFTFIGSWANHYKSWRDNNEFKVLFVRYEDLQRNKYKIFREIVSFINNLKNDRAGIDEKKLINSVESTSFVNLKNKEFNENFEESRYSKDGKRINFFNLGFKNDWKKSLPDDIVNKINISLKKELLELNYF